MHIHASDMTGRGGKGGRIKKQIGKQEGKDCNINIKFLYPINYTRISMRVVSGAY